MSKVDPITAMAGKPNLLLPEKQWIGPVTKKMINEKGIRYGTTAKRSEVVSLQGKLKGGKTRGRKARKTKRRV